MSENAKKKHYLVIAAASYVLVAIVLAMRGQISADGEAIAFFIGHGFGMMLIPILAIRFGSITTGWVVFAVVGFSYGLGSLEDKSVETVSGPFHFQGMNCDFSVTFPSKPTVKIYTNPQIGDYEEALWTGMNPKESTALRTECVRVQLGIDDSNAKDLLLSQLAIYAKNNGLSSVEYRYNLESVGPTGYARGIKYIQEKPVTYLIVVVAGKESLITVYAGGLSATFPSQEVRLFMGSIRKAN